jgi:hypothetical protein
MLPKSSQGTELFIIIHTTEHHDSTEQYERATSPELNFHIQV